MPLTIVAATGPGSACMILQKYFISTNGSRVGSNGFSNCLGLVIHSPRDKAGCLAHVEAVNSRAEYSAWVHRFADAMISRISRSVFGRNIDPNLQAGLFGNRDGPSSQEFTDDIRRMLLALGVPGVEITDQRNRVMAGPFHDAGGNARINGSFDKIDYDPKTGAVTCYNLQMLLINDASWVSSWGTEVTQVQP